ncbi:uncharacterized protein [Engystomops pustulosus]|uniref:uncharacterized protein n=1 Tax=Engystomops pustulosus TaxID=76066 RepID=UPI003AFB4F2D
MSKGRHQKNPPKPAVNPANTLPRYLRPRSETIAGPGKMAAASTCASAAQAVSDCRPLPRPPKSASAPKKRAAGTPTPAHTLPPAGPGRSPTTPAERNGTVSGTSVSRGQAATPQEDIEGAVDLDMSAGVTRSPHEVQLPSTQAAGGHCQNPHLQADGLTRREIIHQAQVHAAPPAGQERKDSAATNGQTAPLSISQVSTPAQAPPVDAVWDTQWGETQPPLQAHVRGEPSFFMECMPSTPEPPPTPLMFQSQASPAGRSTDPDIGGASAARCHGARAGPQISPLLSFSPSLSRGRQSPVSHMDPRCPEFLPSQTWASPYDRDSGLLEEPPLTRADLHEALRNLPTRSFFDSMISRMEKMQRHCLDEVHRTMEQMGSRVGSLERQTASHETRLEQLEQRVTAQQHMIRSLTLEHDDLENRGRRNNVRVRGLPEDEEGGDLGSIITTIFNGVLGDPPETPIELDRVHRALGPKPTDPDSPRDVVCRIHHYRTKERLMRCAREKGRLTYGEVTIQILL